MLGLEGGAGGEGEKERAGYLASVYVFEKGNAERLCRSRVCVSVDSCAEVDGVACASKLVMVKKKKKKKKKRGRRVIVLLVYQSSLV